MGTQNTVAALSVPRRREPSCWQHHTLCTWKALP